MVNLNIDFDRANKISNSLSELVTECTAIMSSCKGVDGGSVSSFSPRTASYCSQIQTSANKISTQITNLQTSFDGSIALYRQAYEDAQSRVENDIVEGSSLNTGKPIVLDDLTASELSATVDYYFNFPGSVKSIKVVSDTKLRNLFTANGATKVGNDTYSFTINGKKYKYNVSTHEVIIDGSREQSLYCKFYTTSDTSFSDITNTVTLLAGSGEIGKGFDTSVKVNSNSLVIIPYGSQNIPNMPNKVSGCTRVGDFLVGGNSKKITNTIVGYSLGGQAAYSAVAANKGLYSKIAVVNSAPMTSSGGLNYIEKFGSYEAFKDVDIYIFEGSGDSFVSADIEALRRFKNHKVPMSNIHVYTNDSNLLSVAKSYLPSENVYKVDGSYAKSHRGWSGHSYGYDMLKDSGIFSYLTGSVSIPTTTAANTTATTTTAATTTTVQTPTTSTYGLNLGASIEHTGSTTTSSANVGGNGDTTYTLKTGDSLGTTTASAFGTAAATTSNSYSLNTGASLGTTAAVTTSDGTPSTTTGTQSSLNTGKSIDLSSPVVSSGGALSVKGGKMLKITYEGKEYYVVNTKINCVDYQRYVAKNGLTQNNGLCPDDCMVLSQYYAVDMLRGTKTSGNTMSQGQGGPAVRMNDYVSSQSRDPVLKYIYTEALAGRPTVLQVTQVNSYKGDRHLVTVVGFDSSVQSYKDLNADNIFVLDCVDGKLQTLSKSRSKGGHERDLFNQGGNYFVRGATTEFLNKEVYNK